MLFPQQNSVRTVFDLGGYWRFMPDPENTGEPEGWALEGLPAGASTIVVPGSWNEQLAERGMMNYVGAAWYETDLSISDVFLATADPWLRIGAVEHAAHVWLNGQRLGHFDGGYLPFEVELGKAWISGKRNRLTVKVDNTLSMTTLPQNIDPAEEPYDGREYIRRHSYPPARFDFHTFGGITRSVHCQLLPRTHLSSIRIDPELNGSVRVGARIRGTTDAAASVRARILDADGLPVSQFGEILLQDSTGHISLEVRNPQLWSPAHPYLYESEVQLLSANGEIIDCYREAFGFREVRVSAGRVFLNGEQLFLTGCGKHEDYPVIGRGQFRTGYLKDFELLRWLGANSFRTSHYPYDEELMRLADRLGFMVIDEVPAVSLGFWSDDFEDLQPLLDVHKTFLTRLVERDRNHPSVISWSVVNEANLWGEPQYQNAASEQYFEEIYRHVKALDDTRPVMSIAFAGHSVNDVSLRFCDIIGINRYFAWYDEPTGLESAANRLGNELDVLFERFGRPIVITEFGADTVEGYHSTTPQLFTEEYQAAYLATYCAIIEERWFCAGEHVWNFADFRTTQHYRRVVLNRKGLFTRERNPKRAAFAMRDHWLGLDRVAEAHRPVVLGGEILVQDLKHATLPFEPEAIRELE